MKKTLLSILAIVLCTSLAAQYITSKDLKHVKEDAYRYTTVYGADNDNAPALVERPSNYTQNKGSSHLIGESNYISMTNTNARNVINWAPDGSKCAVTWTIGRITSTDPPGGERGTALNYLDNASLTWDPIPSIDPLDRIEDGPLNTTWAPGWGAQVYTEEGEVVISHCTAEGGLLVNYRAVRHQGDWEQSIIKGPEQSNKATDLLWATVIAVGNTVHMVCVTNQNPVTFQHPEGGAPIPTCPLYFKSTDGGKTWSDYRVFSFAEMPYDDQEGVSADTYVLAARGTHVVLAYTEGNGNIYYLESKDDGNSWTRHAVYTHTWSWTSTGVWVYPTMYATTTAVAIGDDGLVHVAFGANVRRRGPDVQPNYYTRFPGLAGLFTWKEGQPVMTGETMGITSDPDEGTIIDMDYFDLPNFMESPSVTGHEYFNWQDIDVLDQISSNYRNLGFMLFPRLLAHGGKVYLTYSTLVEQPMLASTNIFYRGTFLTVSHDNGDTYDQRKNTSWLSYRKGVFECNWENYQGPDFTGPADESWIEFHTRSESGYPSMTTNVKNNRLVFSWLSDLLPFPEAVDGNTPVWMPDAFGVYAVSIALEEAGIYNNTDSIWRGIISPYGVNDNKGIIEKINIYPNPVNDMATIVVSTNDTYSLTVSNVMGQVVYKRDKIQQSKVELNVANYPAGVYIVNVKTANATASRKLIVK